MYASEREYERERVRVEGVGEIAGTLGRMSTFCCVCVCMHELTAVIGLRYM